MGKKSKIRKNKTTELIILFVAMSVMLIDQLTKRLFDAGFLGMKTYHNTGAAFSILQNSNMMLLFFSIIVLGGILYFYDRIPKSKFFYVMAGLVIGGIIGNCIDRTILSYVVDFIDLKFWPVFNIADSAVCVGAVGICIYLFKKS